MLDILYFGRKLRLLVRACVGRYLARRRDLEKAEVLVVSPGGVGTTFLIRHLAQFVQTNAPDDRDYLKHLPAPPKGAPKTIFITGHAEEIYDSIDRRRWIDHQGAKLGSPLCVVLSGPSQKAAFLAAVGAQRERWTRYHRDLLVVGYDELWTRAEEIGQFAGITDPRFWTEFPPRRTRTSESILSSSSGQDSADNSF